MMRSMASGHGSDRLKFLSFVNFFFLSILTKIQVGLKGGHDIHWSAIGLPITFCIFSFSLTLCIIYVILFFFCRFPFFSE